jgi:hypothetical protein
MQFATRHEIEYLSNHDKVAVADATFVHEMARQLDALRRYDQHFCDADWLPRPCRNAPAVNNVMQPY